MRLWLVLLILLNVLLYLWNDPGPPVKEQAVGEDSTAVPVRQTGQGATGSLRLAGELEGDRGEPEGFAVDSGHDSASPAWPELEPEPVLEPAPEQPLATGDPAPAIETAGSAPVPPVEPLLADGKCWRIGPFPTPGSVAAVSARLARFGLTGWRRITSEEQRILYQVLLPTGGSDESRRVSGELDKSGIAEHQIVGGKEGSWFVSLGVFEGVGGARKLQAELATAGFRAEIRNQERGARIFWLEKPPSTAGDGDRRQVLQHLPRVAMNPVDCAR